MKSLAVAVFAFSVASAFAGTTSYPWSGSATAYGENVTVTHNDDGQVTELAATVAKGDTIVFTGDTAAVFATNAVIRQNGTGNIEFANPVTNLAAMTMQGSAAGVTIAGGSTLNAGASTTFQTGADLSELKVSAAQLCYVSGGKEQSLSTTLYHERVVDGQYEVQVQNYNGAWTRCVKVRLTSDPDTAGTIKLSIVYARETTVYGVNFNGEDFDAFDPTKCNDTTAIYLKNVTIKTVLNSNVRQVKFSNTLTYGGALTVSKGINCVATGTALGAQDDRRCDIDIVFADGVFTFLDCGKFTQGGTVSGTKGELVYATSDAAEAVAYSIPTDFGLTTNDQVVAYGASLTALTGVTAIVRWQYYNGGKEQVMESAYRGQFSAACFRPIGDETLVRFQAKASGTSMSYAAGVRLLQQGTNIVAKKVSSYNVWHENQPTAMDPWHWDHVNDYFNGDKLRSKDPAQYAFVTNLTLYFSGAANNPNFNTDVTLVHTDSTESVSYFFKPGANHKLTAVVNSQYGVPKYFGKIFVHDRANVELGYPGVSSDYTPTYRGLWPDSSVKNSAAAITVYQGGRMFTNAYRQDSGFGQTITVDGGTYAFRSPTDDTSYYHFYRGKWMSDCCGNIFYTNGGVTDGYAPYLKTGGATCSLTVSGTKPCFCYNSWSLYGGKTSSNMKVCTLNVGDVTGDADVDFTMEGRFFKQNYDCAKVVKTGAGTVLFKRKNDLVYPLSIKAGTVALGIVTESGSTPNTLKNDCSLGMDGVSLDGGNLQLMNCITNKLGGTLKMTASGTLTMGTGSKLTISDSSAETWTAGTRLTIVGDPTTSVVNFGVDGLTETQLQQIRWNRKRVVLDEAGNLQPYDTGLTILVK